MHANRDDLLTEGFASGTKRRKELFAVLSCWSAPCYRSHNFSYYLNVKTPTTFSQKILAFAYRFHSVCHLQICTQCFTCLFCVYIVGAPSKVLASVRVVVLSRIFRSTVTSSRDHVGHVHILRSILSLIFIIVAVGIARVMFCRS
jgi:hypothetical protein